MTDHDQDGGMGDVLPTTELIEGSPPIFQNCDDDVTKKEITSLDVMRRAFSGIFTKNDPFVS